LSTVAWFKLHGVVKPTHTSAFSIRRFYPSFTRCDIRTSAGPHIRLLPVHLVSLVHLVGVAVAAVLSHACNVNVRFQRKK